MEIRNIHKDAGSVRHPILLAKNEVHIRVENFNNKPDIKTDQYHEQNIIKITNISHK